MKYSEFDKLRASLGGKFPSIDALDESFKNHPADTEMLDGHTAMLNAALNTHRIHHGMGRVVESHEGNQ